MTNVLHPVPRPLPRDLALHNAQLAIDLALAEDEVSHLTARLKRATFALAKARHRLTTLQPQPQPKELRP